MVVNYHPPVLFLVDGRRNAGMLEACGKPMRNGFCNKEKGHRGRHSTVAWECDGCGKMRTGSPEATHEEAGWFCFMCVKVPEDPFPDYEGEAMYWLTALEIAHKCADVTYEEWCNLYFYRQSPTEEQLQRCEKTMHAVLVRNHMIEEDVVFIDRPVARREVVL